MKIFISYARVDKPYCQQIAQRLAGVHDVWYDQRLHAGQDWWAMIVDKLNWCDGFVYLLSPESVKSEYCQREFAIAEESGKCLVPVLIQARTEIPASLSHIHYADLSESMDDIGTLMDSLTVAERNLLTRRATPSPPPSPKPAPPAAKDAPNIALAKAADAMEAENFDAAVFMLKEALDKKPTGRWLRIFQNTLAEAEAALERQAYLREAEREYEPIREAVKRRATRAFGCAEFADFRQQFPDYDPDNVADVCAKLKRTSLPVVQTQERAAPPPTPQPTKLAKPDFLPTGILPAPFEWIEIPAGPFLMGSDPKKDSQADDDEQPQITVELPTYTIAKYPVTYVQYEVFVDDGGYQNDSYWTDAGREWRGNNQHPTQYWQDKKWHIADHPVVGVTWYEAWAFSQWLGATSRSLGVRLPTEPEWEKAARGAGGQIYPWGDQPPDKTLCNFGENVDKTTPVTQYSAGASPYGVLDMSGNVWEWCLTKYPLWNYGDGPGTMDNDSAGTARRVRRGGSWDYPDRYARAAARSALYPSPRFSYYGFRVCCGASPLL